MKVNFARVNDRVHFRVTNPEGNTIDVDGAPRVGGEGGGFRPMQLVLAAIASCATMDLVPILEKQRQRLDDISIEVTGERGEGVPSPFTAINIHYELTGDIDDGKARRAIELAVYKYCSVGEMLKATVDITYSFVIHKGKPA